MAVSKRLRFEILRRDNHTCRYCGASAPDASLRVDHVTPEALGGRTEPANLVTACEPCNSGKSSVALDSAMVEDIKADALRFAEVTRQAFAVVLEHSEERTDYEDQWHSVWDEVASIRRIGLPLDWRNTLGRWHGMGVPIELVEDAARIALRDLRTTDPFRYFCGIVWNQVQMVTAEATVKAALDGAWCTEAEIHELVQEAKRPWVARTATLLPDASMAQMVQHFIDGGGCIPRFYADTEEVGV
jgi:hypothetical protein